MRTSALAMLLTLAGCPATAVYRSADPLPPGAWQVGGAVSVGGLRDTEQDTRIPTAAVEVSVRRGVAADLDVGARLYTAGIAANATWRFARGRWSWALAPELGGLRSGESGLSPRALHLFGQTAVIGTRTLSPRWTLSIGPTVGAGLYWPETGGHAGGLWLGGFVNAAARIWSHWSLVPELGTYAVVRGEVPVRGGAVQLGVALVRNL